jgi:hypothetical protein
MEEGADKKKDTRKNKKKYVDNYQWFNTWFLVQYSFKW